MILKGMLRLGLAAIGACALAARMVGAGVGPLPPVTTREGVGTAGRASIQRDRVPEPRACSPGRKGPKPCLQRTAVAGRMVAAGGVVAPGGPSV